MFDTYTPVRTHSNVSYHSVQGTLVRSHKKSKFQRFHLDSEYATNLFNGYGKYADIVPLQFMIVGDRTILMEYVDKADLEERREQ